ncbi:MAG: hypothetical protein H6509_10810 [Bryobacterales bacterium]|nr:hypothetical protein [Bryobacterales bacterium]
MDLRRYYGKIREIEAGIEDEFPVVKSLPTETGGKGGRLTETSRAVAARMIVDGVAELASAEEAAELRGAADEARAREEERQRAEQVQFHVLSENDLRALMKSGGKGRGN